MLKRIKDSIKRIFIGNSKFLFKLGFGLSIGFVGALVVRGGLVYFDCVLQVLYAYFYRLEAFVFVNKAKGLDC